MPKPVIFVTTCRRRRLLVKFYQEFLKGQKAIRAGLEFAEGLAERDMDGL